MTARQRFYVNKDKTVRLNEDEHYWFRSAMRAFKRAHAKDLAYIDYTLRAPIFVPEALADHGQYYLAADRLKGTNPNGYLYLQEELYEFMLTQRRIA